MPVDEQSAATLGPVELYPNRNAMHCWMGPVGCCDFCWGRGYYPVEDEPTDKYCDCPCGAERRRVDGI